MFRTLDIKPGYIVLENGCTLEITLVLFSVDLGKAVGGFPDILGFRVGGFVSKPQCPEAVIKEISNWPVYTGNIFDVEGPWDIINIKKKVFPTLTTEIELNKEIKVTVKITANPYLVTMLRNYKSPDNSPIYYVKWLYSYEPIQ